MRDEGRAANLSGWTVLLLHGPDTRAFLQGLATQDLEATRRGEAAPTFFLNEKGRPVALAWVEIGAEGTRAWVIADEGARSTLRTHLERFRIMEEVEVSGPDEMPLVIGFAGPKKDSLLQEAASSLSGPESAPSTSPQAIQAEPLSFLLVRPGTEASKLRASVASRLADPASFEAWRLATGLPRTGADFDLDRIATELSFPEAISLTKGCYVGQEVVARTSNRGQVRRHRFGVRFDWSGTPIPPRTEIRAGGVVAGYVTSTAPEPSTDQGLGMGYLSSDALQGVEVLAIEGLRTTHLRVGDWPL